MDLHNPQKRNEKGLKSRHRSDPVEYGETALLILTCNRMIWSPIEAINQKRSLNITIMPFLSANKVVVNVKVCQSPWPS